MKGVDGVDTVNQYNVTYHFIQKALKLWQKLFFCGAEVVTVSGYILHVDSCKKNRSKHM
jgi:hypothetical protein